MSGAARVGVEVERKPCDSVVSWHVWAYSHQVSRVCRPRQTAAPIHRVCVHDRPTLSHVEHNDRVAIMIHLLSAFVKDTSGYWGGQVHPSGC